jgi:OOP family OmpA-OmpF porin
MNFNQDDNFDGGQNTESKQTNLNYINTSLGLSIALGKNKQLADSAQEEEVVVYDELDEIKKRLGTAEKEIATLKVTDANINKTNLIYELDTRYAKKGEENKYANTVSGSNVDFIKELLNRGYVNVFFDTNKTSIQKESLPAVNYLRQFMTDNPYVNASLIGYTDEAGEEGYNQILSKKRAKTVYDILVDAGISPTRMTYGGVGEDKTMIKDAKQLARKVSFRIN